MSDVKCSNEKRPDSEEQKCFIKCYKWKTSQWSDCTKSCDGGSQNRSVSCVSQDEVQVRDEYCTASERPIHSQICNNFACPVEWRPSSWNSCSRKCGKGIQQREVLCIYGGKVVHESYCKNLIKPTYERECHGDYCGTWKTTSWSSCSKSCGQGVRTRNVYCTQHELNSYPFFECDADIKPLETENCSISDSCNEWLVGNWSICSKTCGNGYQKRTVFCANLQGGCDPSQRPKSYRLCKIRECKRVKWRVGKWSEVSVYNSFSTIAFLQYL